MRIRRILNLIPVMWMVQGVLPSSSAAQPYYFYWAAYEIDPSVPQFERIHRAKVCRYNLRGGETDTLLSNQEGLEFKFVLADQQRLFLGYGDRYGVNEIYVWNPNAPSEPKRLVFSSNERRVSYAAEAPLANRLYFFMVDPFDWDDDDEGLMLILDRTTYAIVDSSRTFVGESPDRGPFFFLSRDQRFAYDWILEEGMEGIHFDVYATSDGSKLTRKRVGPLRRFTYGPSLYAGKNGYAVMSYAEQRGWANNKYTFCDIDRATVMAVIPFPWRSEVALSGDGRKALIQEIPWMDGPKRTGRYWVFETETGKLLQKITLPVQGMMHIFETHPDEIFYVSDLSKPTTIGLTEVTPANVFLDTVTVLTQQAFSTNQLGDKRFLEELERDLQQAKTKLAKSDSIGCAQELEEFQDEVKKEYLAKDKKNDKRFVSDDAYKTLYFNAHYIIDRAITRPPRSYAPLLNQLAALRIQIRTDAQQELLAGEILIKGLEAMVDGARQRLERQDSLGTALYLLLFRRTVRQTYELSKNRTIGKIYVRPEGYISLYYRAGYVLEGLPEPTVLLLPKMEPELERELRRYRQEVEQQR
ncbi:MAG: hypothetical protein FJ217_15545 [Ignavibacteria bacterium]|nr:hypothetical protein [Ignavibacteria bacterium]